MRDCVWASIYEEIFERFRSFYEAIDWEFMICPLWSHIFIHANDIVIHIDLDHGAEIVGIFRMIQIFLVLL